MESSGQEETSLGIIFLCKYDHVIANTHRASENKDTIVVINLIILLFLVCILCQQTEVPKQNHLN